MRLDMSIVKFEISFPELKQALEKFTNDRLEAFDHMLQGIRQGASEVLNQVLNAEMGVYLGTPDQADNKRNGYEHKEYTVKGLGTIKIKVPIDRKRQFNSKIIPKHERLDPRLAEDMAALQLAGLSSRTLSLMSKRILGIDISHMKASSCIPLMSEQATAWGSVKNFVSGSI